MGGIAISRMRPRDGTIGAKRCLVDIVARTGDHRMNGDEGRRRRGIR